MPPLLTPQTQITSIPVANKPPLLGGVIHEFSQEEFYQKFGLFFREGIWLDETFSKEELYKAKQKISSTFPTTHFYRKIPHIIDHPFENVCIAFIDSKVGYGVFATRKIKKGMLVCIYSGEIGSIFDKNLKGLEHGYVNTQFCFKQTMSRGIASFLQHFPIDPKASKSENKKETMQEESEIYFTQFISDEVRQKLATVNLDKEYLIYNGIPLVAFVANRDIEAGEQLGIKYGLHYWRAIKIHPEFFEKSGAVIPKQYYCRTYGDLYFGHQIYSGDFTYLRAELKKNEFILLRTNHGTHQFPTHMVKQALINAGAFSLVIGSNATILDKWKKRKDKQTLQKNVQAHVCMAKL